MHFYIYKITNRLNGHFYIGCHKTKKLDDNYKGSGKNLWKAYREFGHENFKKEILFFCEDLVEMLKSERQIVDEYFIARLDTYNIIKGGNGGGGFKDRKHTDLSKKKMSEIAKGKKKPPFSKEHLKHMSESRCKRPSSGASGVKWSEESKEKIRVQVKCPYCDKIGLRSIMGRWHFSNCKQNPSKIEKKKLKAPTTPCPNCNRGIHNPNFKKHIAKCF